MRIFLKTCHRCSYRRMREFTSAFLRCCTLIPSDAPDGQDPQPVVVLSYRFWSRHFNSDTTVVGRNLQLVHKNYTIIGVLPSRFTIGDADVYLPLKLTNDPNLTFNPRVRLRPGVTHEAA